MLPSRAVGLLSLCILADLPAAARAFISGPKATSYRHSYRYMSACTAGLAMKVETCADKKISVAVIGGGIAGLSCASTLSQSDTHVPTVFDTGRLRPGGRCSSRLPGDSDKTSGSSSKNQIIGSVVVDHAAQILSVPKSEGFEAFANKVKQWEQDGIIREFPRGSVCEIVAGKNNEDHFELKKIQGSKMYYGNGGMNSVVSAIINSEDKSFEIQQDVWVSPGNGVKFIGGKGEPQWKVQRNGKTLGVYDRLVVAHNGKCADRLMSKTPAKKLHSLLRTNFSPTVPKWGGKRMTLNSIYSYTFAIKSEESPLTKQLGDNIICCFVKNEPKLRLLTCQTKKQHDGQKNNNRIEVWTVLSSPTFAKKYKAPQENIPDEISEEVIDLLQKAIENSLALSPGSLSADHILDSRLQLWGAAVPLNTWKTNSTSSASGDGAHADSGFLYDADFGVGSCGDWLLDPSVGGAWTSGMRLAEWMLTEDQHKAQSVGLPPNGSFEASRTVHQAAIGNIR